MQMASRTLIALLVFPVVAIAQTAGDVLPAVVFLQGDMGVQQIEIGGKRGEAWFKEAGSNSPRPIKAIARGTGFIVMAGGRLFLVTAEHVAASIPFDATATLRGSGGEPVVFALPALSGGNAVAWITHGEADVAVLPLSPSNTFQAAIKAVNLEQLSTEETAPSLDSILTTVGFPLALGVQGRFSPIVKTSRPAGGFFRHARFDKPTEATFFILDDPSVAGFSGAPVFRLPVIRMGGVGMGQGAFQCVGLVHGTFSDDTGGKFAAVVPAKFIAETVRKAVTR